MSSTAANTWNPYKAFQINQDQLHCAGWAPSMGRECHNPVGQEWRAKAKTIMGYIVTMDPHYITAKDLDDLAFNLLCVRYHRHNNKGERDVLTAKWLKNLQIYLKAPRQSSSVAKKPTEELKNQLVDAQIDRVAKVRSLVVSQEVSAGLTLQLEDTQRRLANKESRCDELQALNDKLTREKKEKEGVCELYLREKWSLADQLKIEEEQHRKERAADRVEIERLNVLLGERENDFEEETLANETLKDKLKEFTKTSQEKISRIAALKNECGEKENTITELQTKLANKDDTLTQKENTITELQTELANKDDALTRMRTDLQTKDNTLNRVEQTCKDQVAEIKGHREGNRRLKAKVFLQACIMSRKNRELEEAKADNEAMFEQHKILQRAKTEVDAELKTLEVSLLSQSQRKVQEADSVLQKVTTPLKLRNIKKGFAGVLSIHPMRLRTHRISGEDPTTSMNESTLMAIPEG